MHRDLWSSWRGIGTTKIKRFQCLTTPFLMCALFSSPVRSNTCIFPFHVVPWTVLRKGGTQRTFKWPNGPPDPAVWHHGAGTRKVPMPSSSLPEGEDRPGCREENEDASRMAGYMGRFCVHQWHRPSTLRFGPSPGIASTHATGAPASCSVTLWSVAYIRLQSSAYVRIK